MQVQLGGAVCWWPHRTCVHPIVRCAPRQPLSCVCCLFAPAQTENTATINQQKRKMSRQHDVLLNLKSKYGRTDSKFCDKNSKLTEEYKRITEHFKDMQVSATHTHALGCG